MSNRPATRSREPRPGDRLLPAGDRFEDRAHGGRLRAVKRFLGGLVVVGALVGLGWVAFFSPVLAVTTVRVSGTPDDTVDSIRAAAAVERGVSLLAIDTDAVEARVGERPEVAHVAVERSLPHTLTVDVTLRRPVLAVRTGDGLIRVVDVEGVVFGTVERAPEGVPLVRSTAQGPVSDHSVDAALSMVRAMPPDLTADVRHLEVSDADILTFRLGSTTVVWGAGDHPRLKVEIIRALWEGTPQDPDVIDVSAPATPVTR